MNLPNLASMHPAFVREHLTAASRVALWNAVIPSRAVRFVDAGTHVRVLHATKGWRKVHKRRLGLTPEDRV